MEAYDIECVVRNYISDLHLEEDLFNIEQDLLPPVLFFEKTHPDAQLPTYATAGAAGMDIRSVDTLSLRPGQSDMVSTGLKVMIPEGWELQVRPRSGLAAKYGVTVLNSPGTIDSDYRGEIRVILINTSIDSFDIKAGDRIAQLVCARVPRAVIKQCDKVDDTQRGSGGFGSTGTT